MKGKRGKVWGNEGMWMETIFVRENEKRRERERGHYSLNITNTLVNYCISHAKLVLLPMELDISMTILPQIFKFDDFNEINHINKVYTLIEMRHSKLIKPIHK